MASSTAADTILSVYLLIYGGNITLQPFHLPASRCQTLASLLRSVCEEAISNNTISPDEKFGFSLVGAKFTNSNNRSGDSEQRHHACPYVSCLKKAI
jgi:hypothetical protein